jgi:hypothetical protein
MFRNKISPMIFFLVLSSIYALRIVSTFFTIENSLLAKASFGEGFAVLDSRKPGEKS